MTEKSNKVTGEGKASRVCKYPTCTDISDKQYCPRHAHESKASRVELNEGQSIFGAAQVVPKLLSDGSLVYDVQVLDGQNIVEICALDEMRAIECAAQINRAIGRAVGK